MEQGVGKTPSLTPISAALSTTVRLPTDLVASRARGTPLPDLLESARARRVLTESGFPNQG